MTADKSGASGAVQAFASKYSMLVILPLADIPVVGADGVRPSEGDRRSPLQRISLRLGRRWRPLSLAARIQFKAVILRCTGFAAAC